MASPLLERECDIRNRRFDLWVLSFIMSLQTASPFLSLYISKYQNIDHLSPTSIVSEGDAIDEKRSSRLSYTFDAKYVLFCLVMFTSARCIIISGKDRMTHDNLSESTCRNTGLDWTTCRWKSEVKIIVVRTGP